MGRNKVALDVDGVIADFYLAVCKKFKKPYISISDWEIDWIRNNFHKIEKDESFIRTLPLLNPPETITFEFECYMTSLPEKLLDQRQEWLLTNGFPDKPIIISNEKEKTMLEMGINILVDDKPDTIKKVNDIDGLIGIQYIPKYWDFQSSPPVGPYHVWHLPDVELILSFFG